MLANKLFCGLNAIITLKHEVTKLRAIQNTPQFYRIEGESPGRSYVQKLELVNSTEIKI